MNQEGKSDKIRVAVLYGGRSAEHEISCRSAANVIQHLDPKKFEVIPIGIDKQGHWFLSNEVYVNSLENHTVTKSPTACQTWFTPEWVGKSAEQDLPAKTEPGKLLLQTKQGKLFDVVFPVVHGTFCEDGSLQGLLELANLPYVGCGVLASAIGMDKDVSKRLVMNAGLHVAPYFTLKYDQWQKNSKSFMSQVTEELAYPVFVKPANTGSSIGVSKAKDERQLQAAINKAFCFDTKILVEKGLEALELEIAALEALEEDTDPIVSVVGEVKPNDEFYSYEAKYLSEDGAELVIPATVSTEIKNEARVIAKKIFRILECEGMVRVDLFFNKQNQKIYFNEINTIPGFTQLSMYPKLMDASGIPYENLLTHLIQLAIKRHKMKSQLIRSYAG